MESSSKIVFYGNLEKKKVEKKEKTARKSRQNPKVTCINLSQLVEICRNKKNCVATKIKKSIR